MTFNDLLLIALVVSIKLPVLIVNVFCCAGVDLWKNNQSSDNLLLCDIPLNKIVLLYEAKACYKHVCKDLSHTLPPLDGTLTGHMIDTWDIKVCRARC